MFDHDAMTAALEPPKLKIGGQVYTGRVLSFPEYQAWVAKFAHWSAGLLEAPDRRPDLVALFTDLGFAPDVVERLLAGPPAGIAGAARDFFAHQYRVPELNGTRAASPPAA